MLFLRHIFEAYVLIKSHTESFFQVVMTTLSTFSEPALTCLDPATYLFSSSYIYCYSNLDLYVE